VAGSLFAAHIDEKSTIGPVSQAEVLVRAAREGRDEEMASDIDALGIAVTPMPTDAGRRLAKLRAATAAKMPDCCVLLTAQQADASVATFDDRLRRAAEGLGIRVLPC